MEYIFLLNPYNNIGIKILQQYSGSDKHIILPIAFDWDIQYVKLFDEIDVKKTYLTVGLGSGLRILEDHLNPIKSIKLVLIQDIPLKLNMKSYSNYHLNHFTQLKISTNLLKNSNYKMIYYRPKKEYLKQILNKDVNLQFKFEHLISASISYLYSLKNDNITIIKYNQ